MGFVLVGVVSTININPPGRYKGIPKAVSLGRGAERNGARDRLEPIFIFGFGFNSLQMFHILI